MVLSMKDTTTIEIDRETAHRLKQVGGGKTYDLAIRDLLSLHSEVAKMVKTDV